MCVDEFTVVIGDDDARNSETWNTREEFPVSEKLLRRILGQNRVMRQ